MRAIRTRMLGGSVPGEWACRKECSRVQYSSMPTISEFLGIVSEMFWREHGPPHFHATYAEHEAIIDIRTLAVLRGSLPRRALGHVLEWTEEHQAELLENWELCSTLKTPRQIPPLE
ncbi:MAG: DUF4160 domain-containing protein [Planctomycetaceae bacterium]